MRRSLSAAALVPIVAMAMGACDDTPSLPDGVGTLAACDDVGVACTWAGIPGENGFNGDGNHRLETKLSLVQDLLFLDDGTAWFTDFNNFLIRKVLPDDQVASVVGTTSPIFPGDGPLGGSGPDGAPGGDWQLNHPTALFKADDGTVMVVAWHNHKLLNVEPDTGWVRIVTGKGAGFAGDGSEAAAGLFKQPSDAVLADDGSIYIVDQQNQRIRRLDASGQLSTFAGAGTSGFSGDGGQALEAEFSWEVGSNPNPSGGIAIAGTQLYVSDTLNNRVRSIDLSTGVIDTLAGNGTAGFSGDGGDAREASLRAPRDLEIGPDGDLYIADTDNGAVRAVDLETGVIRTVVGTGENGMSDTEGLPATQTLLRRPMGIAFDGEGRLYVMDSLNDRIVRVVL